MKRFLPFLIIAVVAFVTVGTGALFYREKTRPAPAPPASAAVRPTPAEAPEDPFVHVRGPSSAPVTLEIYGDFQCPSCALVSQAIDELQKQYEGKMRVIFHEFPLEMHKHALEAALAAEAAAVQGKFWEMHDMLYQYQPVWSNVSNAKYFFESYAESLGLDVARFRADCQAEDLRSACHRGWESRGEPRGEKYAHDFHQRKRAARRFHQGQTARDNRDGSRPQEKLLTMARKSKHFPAESSPAARTRSSMVYWIVAVIALLGLADATFLTVAHLTGDDAVCGSFAGCSAVLGSAYATIKGIPTAAFGAIAYFTVFSAAILAAFGYTRVRGFLFTLVASMFIASLYFLYLQAFVLHAFCPFCLFSAAMTFLLAGAPRCATNRSLNLGHSVPRPLLPAGARKRLRDDNITKTL